MTEPQPEPSRVTISDPQTLRALAHPARLAIMEHLASTEGAVTATECAEVARLSPSATSYHLRALARFGLVEAAPSRGDARERLWRSTVQSWTIDAGRAADPSAREAERSLVEVFLARELERSRDWLRRAADEPQEWYDNSMLNESLLLLTAEELAEVNRAVLEVLRPYRKRSRTDPPPGARRVAIQYKALPLD
ncbi:ArsR/SmtB family transcription factor [Micromonospora endophytica]|uniref:ArsR family transcriptional regulator n=1 Tax=Micromonospora endophytica TaxID=515350 RepID=A0A2W2D3I0_9ACTN|nr:helix-turn-helix domain-containing protein [Micromonospora endophytica]PZF87043.1 ArsR family transcriptional regulator [Micromonospora endophytica]RIW49164.1 ArsR family transcriptional regulator [Micromonospora endophytica]BCJ59070.1 transcriptional regulator [Micromonospora endophytica]